MKPERMSRIAIVGPRKRLDVTIKTLYELGLFHVVDYLGEDPEVKIGKPLPQATELSQKLLKLRSIVRALHLEEAKTERKVTVEEIEQTSDQTIATLEGEVNKKVEARQTLTSKIRELAAQNESLAVFSSIGLPMDVFSESNSIASISGTAPSPISETINTMRIAAEIVAVPHGNGYAFSLFFKKSDLEAVQQAIGSSGYQEIKPPVKGGSAADWIAANEHEIEEQQKALADMEGKIESLREKYAALVLAAEEHYSIEIQKAETPLRVATTQHSFTIDGWAPVDAIDTIKAAVAEHAGRSVTVESLQVSKEEEDEQAPVKLKNSRIVKPFELFIELMSTPLYREIDPTFPVFIVFPLFFGLMIGDFGYGCCLMLAGYVMFAKFGRESDGWRKLGFIVFAGGLMAAVFGSLLFCEAFGLPFHPTDKYPMSWEALGINIPLEAHLEKLIAVGDFLALSIVFAWLHLSLGLIFGFINERKHETKEAIMKILWLLILQAMSFQILLIGSSMGNHIAVLMMNTVGAPFAAMTVPFSGIMLSVPALAIILFGVIGFFAIHGKGATMEILEILSLLANIISYARIAAIGVAKGATAYAFNFIVSTYFMSGGDILIGVIGAVVLVLLQLIVFALGSLSAGIQAIRLNYVEFFLKFYNGGGVGFEPLGYKRKYSEKSEV